MVTCIGFVVLLTPTGSLPTPRWRWWARFQVAATVLLVVAAALTPHPLEPEDPTFESPLAAPAALSDLLAVAGVLGVVTLLGGLLAAAVSLVVRFRRARGQQRQQLRWLALARRCQRWRCWSRWPPRCWADPSRGPGCRGISVRCCPWPRAAICATACMTWTGSSAGPWLRLLTLLLVGGYAVVVLGSASCSAATPAWSWPPPPGCGRAVPPVRRRIQQGVDRVSTAAATTPPDIATFSARCAPVDLPP